ncbi:MAG: restriction endonuclease subunit S [Christensenellaceae bacterium]|jgi:restriction endonuclease S subunit|nr:restriction endonuclease subunit S [Christensenellaceae bacterium]
MKHVRIVDVAQIITNRISCDRLSVSTYVSTENMQPNFGGVVNAIAMPSTAVTSFEQDDILISNIRPYFKKLWYARFDGGCSTDVICLRVTNANCLSKYLFYQLNANRFINTFVGSSKGTKMPRGDKQVLLSYDFCLPNLIEQQHIVDIIGSLDKKIELNQQIIEIADKFCRLEFKKALLLSKEKKFCEISGLSISNETYKSFTNKLYLDTSSINGQNVLWENCKSISSDIAPSRARMKPITNSIWFAKIKNSPKYLLIKDYMIDYLENLVLSTGFMGIKAKPELTNIYYYYFTSDEFYKLQGKVCNGVTMEGLSNSLLKVLIIPEFNSTAVTEFNKNCEEIIYNNYNLRDENKKLCELKFLYLKKFFDYKKFENTF